MLKYSVAVLFSAVAVCLIFSGVSDGAPVPYEDEFFKYELDAGNNTAAVVGLKAPSVTDPNIPDTVNGAYSVTSIKAKAFQHNTDLTGTLTLPNSLITIGDTAFYGCRGLTGNLIIPDSVTTIGRSAFADCSGFKGSLSISDKATSIGNFAFASCTGLTGNLIIPGSVIWIGDYTFASCTGLTGLTIHEGVTSIGKNAFLNCTGLTGNLIIPDSVTTIDEYAFSGCTGFDGYLKVSEKAPSIGNYAFEYCTNLTGNLTVPGLVTSIGNYAFRECVGFTALTISEGVKSIGTSAFYGCKGLTGSLVIPSTVTSIGIGAFSGCESLTGDLVIPDTVTSIGYGAFFKCTGFKGSLTISKNITSIEEITFFQCTGLTGSLTIPENVKSIGRSAFDGCTGLTGDLVIPDSVTTIIYDAFKGCSGFDGSLVVSDKTTAIGESAFYGCTGISLLRLGAPLSAWKNLSLDLNGSGESQKEYPVFCDPGNRPPASSHSDLTVLFYEGEVSVTVTPAGAGTTSGAGTYAVGTTVTIGASAAEGYGFDGWSDGETANPRTVDVLGKNMVFEAVFNPPKFTITFDSAGGTPVGDITLDYGAAVVAPDDPTRDGFVFAGWTPALPETMPNNNFSVTAGWNETFTIKWSVNGAVTEETYVSGELPTYKGAKPGRQPTAGATYEFTGWSPAITSVSKDETYVAQFSESPRSYAVTWSVDGNVTEETYVYGQTPEYKGSTDKAADAEYTYTFTGWSPGIVPVSKDETYVAQYDRTEIGGGSGDFSDTLLYAVAAAVAVTTVGALAYFLVLRKK